MPRNFGGRTEVQTSPCSPYAMIVMGHTGLGTITSHRRDRPLPAGPAPVPIVLETRVACSLLGNIS